ncbi:MAG TPA: DNA polymerase III subunit epsilon [Burkholderiales bacterium]|nr:DNA polymerase III subunit epsilon [Burkholderiales bacterium]
MRQIVLDTETTGLDPKLGHRVIELAAVEMQNRRLTGNRFHRYLNPEREIDEKAQEIHGLSREFLEDKPKFRDIAGEFLDFVEGSELIIHNAPFDLSFLDAELGLLDFPGMTAYCGYIDTLVMAKELHPGKRNNLDALCERYAINNAKRTLHGALLDAELLAEVYLAMTRGQESLVMELEGMAQEDIGAFDRRLVVHRADADELEAHAAQLEEIDKASKGSCLWKLT